ncbi:DUF2178 domain-containing protein [Candidatus Wolfebacteria bacterium]|nr:DUF2178 domain-containing protein [Candidatus Wolfebacteria bacterium]
MTKKSFSIYRLVAVIIVAIVIGVSINYGNWYLPLIIIVASWVFLYILRQNVKEIMADERDYMIAGKASLWAMRIYLGVSVIIGLILYVAGIDEKEGILFGIATALLYSASFLMVVYAVLFKIYEKKNENS